jgi:glycosyltransferase involved in cell wall biosynthesis
MQISVIIPVFNGADHLPEALGAVLGQSLPRNEYEVVLVDDGSTDGSADLAQGLPVRCVRQKNGGPASARNAGIREACGEWVAFTDADCVPSRRWLEKLLAAVRAPPRDPPPLGAAGRLVGLPCPSSAARFVDLSGGLDTTRHLAHPEFPFAPTGNVMYRRASLLAVGGFDPRFVTYEACDLHTRLREHDPGPFLLEPRALVLHRHRETWRRYVRQQFFYGKGLGQFYLRYRSRIRWGPLREASTWLSLLPAAAWSVLGGGGDRALVRRGSLLKRTAQRLGFLTTYWNAGERRRWERRR